MTSVISAPPKETLLPPTKPQTHTLPASWWTSPSIFDLEKRAIFNKSWLFTTHTSRFKKAGDYYSYTVCGINFFLIKTKQNQIKAFHNVCRHRAYPVIKKSSGSTTVLGCKYHGWSYGVDGELKKAPHFDGVEGFEKEENGLFEIATYVSLQGLVFVNFDAELSKKGVAATKAAEFDEETSEFMTGHKNTTALAQNFKGWFEGLESEMKEYDFGDYEYHMSYELDGEFNWKTLMDGYQECYHCPTAHPGLNSAFKMETYAVVPKSHYCRHYAEIVKDVEPEAPAQTEAAEGSWFGFGKKGNTEATNSAPKPKKENPGGEFNGMWMYLYPTNGVNCYSPAWYSIRVLPITPNRTILQYDIYTKKGLSDIKKKEFVDFLQLVELEDFNLCQLTQKNLNQGVYTTGVLHPTKERGVVYYQGVVRDMVKKHYELEKAEGREVNPAFVGSELEGEVLELDQLCKDVECGKTKEVEW